MTDSPSFFEAFDAFTRKPEPEGRPARVVTPGVPGDDDDPVVIGDPAAYVRTVLDVECRGVAECHEGGRNHQLNTAAFALGRLIAGGLPLDEDVAVDRLTDAAEAAGLEPGETAKTIRSGLTGGARSPLAWTQGDRVAMATPTPIPAHLANVSIIPGAAAVTPDGQFVRERTSWWPQNAKQLAAQAEEPPPALLHRTDGVALVYAGKVNALIGESESGKTWVALEAVRQVLCEPDGVVGMLDFEDSYGGIKGRLVDMGLTVDQLARLYYCSPAESLTEAARADLVEFLRNHSPALVVVDGVNAAMTLMGMDLQDNKEATRFNRELLRPLTAFGAGVITVDHVTKSRDGRGNYAIGAQAKRADINGASFGVEVVEPFGRGMTGRLKITVTKDRPGHVRARAVGAKHIAETVIASTDDGVTVSLYGLSIEDVDPVMELMEVLSRFIETAPDIDAIQSYGALAKAVTRREDAVRKAVQKLEQTGKVTRDEGVWRHLVPYRRHGAAMATPITPEPSGALPEFEEGMSAKPSRTPPPIGGVGGHAQSEAPGGLEGETS